MGVILESCVDCRSLGSHFVCDKVEVLIHCFADIIRDCRGPGRHGSRLPWWRDWPSLRVAERGRSRLWRNASQRSGVNVIQLFVCHWLKWGNKVTFVPGKPFQSGLVFAGSMIGQEPTLARCTWKPLLTNIWDQAEKGLLGTNSLAYLTSLSVTKKKSFMHSRSLACLGRKRLFSEWCKSCRKKQSQIWNWQFREFQLQLRKAETVDNMK